MNSVIFIPRVILHCGGSSNFAELPAVLLTCVIVGVIFVIFGILANILHVKISQGFGYTSIHWADIKPTFDNSFLGCLGGFFGCAFIGVALFMGLVVGVYWCIITL